MKITFKFGIKTFSGTVDEMTFGSYREDTICIGRKYVIPALTANNTLRGTIMKNLSDIWASVSSGYKADLKIYALKNAANIPQGKLPPTAFSIWMQMLYAFAKSDAEHIDLGTLTYTDLQTIGADIASVKEAVLNGYLATVPGAEDLTATM